MSLHLSIDEIMRELAAPQSSPRAAIVAAAGHRLTVTRRVLAAYESCLAASDANAFVEAGLPILIGSHLLAEWRVTALCAPLLRALRLPGNDIEELFGDAITETLHRVVASVFDGELEPLLAVIANERVDRFAAGMLCQALLTLLAERAIAAEPVATFVRGQFAGRSRKTGNDNIWYSLTKLVAALRLGDLKPQVLLAHMDGRIARTMQFYSDFESDWREWAGGFAAPPESEAKNLRLWEGTADYFDGWRWSEAGEGSTPRDSPGGVDIAPAPQGKVGRNDPCPCGSGRKYKKCCLAKDAAPG